jgi:hypothetical protein
MIGEFPMSQKLVLGVSFLFFLSSCGHYSAPESFEAKMARYQIRHNHTGVIPQIEPINFKSTKSRAPASVEAEQFEATEEVNFSNKKLYFVALYRQYNQMTSYSSTPAREIKQCPSFHSAMVDHATIPSGQTKWSVSYQNNKLNDENYARYFPELYLPVGQDSAIPRVIDLARKDHSKLQALTQQAVDRHVDKTYAELAELCEYGTSDNYYAFENLHTEIKRRNVTSADSEGMKILLKTTLFSNKALLQSLSRNTKASRAPASIVPITDYDSEVMKRLGVPWAKQYFNVLHGPSESNY